MVQQALELNGYKMKGRALRVNMANQKPKWIWTILNVHIIIYEWIRRRSPTFRISYGG